MAAPRLSSRPGELRPHWFSRVACIAAAGIALAGCATSPRTLTDRTLPNDVHWYALSAEKRALYLQTYAAAGRAARELSAGLAPRSWGVILDVDETALDNSAYQRGLAAGGRSYTEDSWNAWVRERRAVALPGVARFIDLVRDELQGQVVFVTNRLQAQCADTDANLRAQDLRFDLLLCNTGSGDKNPRFQSVLDGTAGLPATRVLLWIGDNIGDFPELSQQHPGAEALFGSRYFVLPNPMYGSWQDDP